jgi:hypothetical protein
LSKRRFLNKGLDIVQHFFVFFEKALKTYFFKTKKENKMSLFSRGIVAAMEDEMANQELAIDEAGADSMEADLVETVDMAADIDAGTNEMEQTVKDADQLERHVEVLTDAEGEGGASPELIEATEIAVEGIYNRLGIYGGIS